MSEIEYSLPIESSHIRWLQRYADHCWANYQEEKQKVEPDLAMLDFYKREALKYKALLIELKLNEPQPSGPALESQNGRKANSCRSCGKPIIWLPTASGKSIPVNAFSVRNGEKQFNPAAGHLTHFATCPQAAQHRKQRTVKGWND